MSKNDDPAKAPEKRFTPPGRRFEHGNPGKPKGAIHKVRLVLADEFIVELRQQFLEHGAEAFRRVRKEFPLQFLRLVAALVPREVNVKISDYSQMTDEEIEQRVQFVSGQLLELRARESAAAAIGASETEPAPALLPVPEAKGLP